MKAMELASRQTWLMAPVGSLPAGAFVVILTVNQGE